MRCSAKAEGQTHACARMKPGGPNAKTTDALVWGWPLTSVLGSPNFCSAMIAVEKLVFRNFLWNQSMNIVAGNVDNGVCTAFGRLRKQQIELVALMDMNTEIKANLIHE